MPNLGRDKHSVRTVIEALDPDVDPQVLRVMERLRHVALMLFRAGDSSLATTGLSYAKYHILLNLLMIEEGSGTGQLHPSQLSDLLGTSRNTISALIGDLEDDGLLERQIDHTDRRRINVGLTVSGRRLVRDHASHHLQAVERCFSALNEEELAALSRLLDKLSHSAALKETRR